MIFTDTSIRSAWIIKNPTLSVSNVLKFLPAVAQRCLAHDFAGGLILAQPQERGLPHDGVFRPTGQRYFADQLRFYPGDPAATVLPEGGTAAGFHLKGAFLLDKRVQLFADVL